MCSSSARSSKVDRPVGPGSNLNLNLTQASEFLGGRADLCTTRRPLSPSLAQSRDRDRCPTTSESQPMSLRRGPQQADSKSLSVDRRDFDDSESVPSLELHRGRLWRRSAPDHCCTPAAAEWSSPGLQATQEPDPWLFDDSDWYIDHLII